MLDHAEVAALLPHAHPMVLLDRVIALEPGRSISGIKAITGGEPCYQGLAKSLARWCYAFPRSLTLESFGQAAAILWIKSRPHQDAGAESMLLFGAVRKCEFDGNAFPGDVLRHEVRLSYNTAGSAVVDGDIFVGAARIGMVTSMIAVQRPLADIARRG